ncbi:hypothetical protein [Propioniciclava sinopodophylli]|uniref:hypothetical protein n=1 Tax=Propioniciclava sinopodophylli TaxID=1837344 RepID=UPI0013F15BAA|nr:hypothetical protein [Propioniciclava sinopodophylli]
MASLEQRNHARAYLTKAEEYFASAEANLAAEARRAGSLVDLAVEIVRLGI